MFLTPLQNPLWEYVDLTFLKPSHWSKCGKLSIVENIMIINLKGLMEKLFAMRYPVRKVCSCLYTFVFFVFLLSIIFTLCGGETDTVFSANLAHFMSIAVFFVTLNRFCEAAAMVNVSSGQWSLIKTFCRGIYIYTTWQILLRNGFALLRKSRQKKGKGMKLNFSCQLLPFLLHWIDFVKQQPW